MAYNVSAAFREQCYSGESLYSCRLIIGEDTIPISQIASITISSPIIDSNSETFYIGTFISQQLTIEFKNLDGIDTTSGTNVELYISQNVEGTDIEVPIGKYVIDESPENYYQSAKIVCLDYAIKFATNLDYSSAFVDNKITIDNLLQWICNHYGVTLGSYPSINGNVEIGTYDSTVSGKRWISYIAEIKGCNAKMDRLGQLTLVPIKSQAAVTIDALKSASWELGEKFEISQVTFFDAIRNYTYGTDTKNTLFLRQDNPFIIDTNVVENVYNAVKDLQIWSLKCDNYGDISLDAWDIIQYTLGNETYYTYNNNTITYAMTIMSKVETKIPTKQQEVTTNVLGGNEEVQVRRLKTEVNAIENTITLQAEQIATNTADILDINDELSTPTSIKQGEYFDLEDALDEPLIDFKMYGNTSQSGTPTPSSPQQVHVVSGDNTIEICGKNLLNVSSDNVYIQALNNPDITSTYDTTKNRVDYSVNSLPQQYSQAGYYYSFKTTIGKTYKIKSKFANTTGTPLINVRICSDKTGTTVVNNMTSETEYTFTSSQETYYLRVWVGANIGTGYIEYAIISDIDTTYEAYTGNSQLISLGDIELNKISTYQDYIYKSNNIWYLHKEIGKVVLDGSENWIYAKASNNNNRFKLEQTMQECVNILSNYFIYKTDNTYGTIFWNSYNLWILYDTSDVNTFKTWLSTHNTDVYYVLDTSTDTEITDETLLEQLNNLMTLPLYKNLTHITLTPNDLQPLLEIEYYRDTTLNNTFVPRSEMSNYYTKTETISQIQISNSGIQQNVAEMQTTLDSNGNAINTISNQVQTLQSSTSQQINIINEQLENGVTKVKTTTGYTFDEQGLGISKGEDFKNLITDRNQVITSGGKEQLFIGYDDVEKRTVARIPTLESQQATIGVHRTEIITKNGKKRTAGFYVGGGN